MLVCYWCCYCVWHVLDLVIVFVIVATYGIGQVKGSLLLSDLDTVLG